MVQENSNQIYENCSIDQTGVLTDDNGNDVIVHTPGETALGIRIDATDTASYAVDVSGDNSRYFDDEVQYDQSDQDTSNVSDTIHCVSKYLRLRVTTAASNGATADVYIAKED